MTKVKTVTATEIGVELKHSEATLAFIKKHDYELYQTLAEKKKERKRR